MEVSPNLTAYLLSLPWSLSGLFWRIGIEFIFIVVVSIWALFKRRKSR
jgi:hypothetical protein